MIKKWVITGSALLAILYLLLLIPGHDYAIQKGSQKPQFAWNQDNRWRALEQSFIEARRIRYAALSLQIEADLNFGKALLDSISSKSFDPDNPIFQDLENNIFWLAALVAACPQYLDQYKSYAIRLRNIIKSQSRHWDMSAEPAQNEIYRLLYGERAALEEIMLQAYSDSLSPLMLCCDESSSTPSAKILGVTIHSGDILVSRGGVPTSALIARGNNYQGNFSHVALVYVDSLTNQVSIIESHIERGVTISPIEVYLKDKKLRVMILRLRHDLPALIADPMLPHRVAHESLFKASSHHIPYDFEMNTSDESKMFCSEVVYNNYLRAGIKLWSKTSHISSPGMVAWLSAFGVTHFDTPIPSDLEYDPQIQVVAEWRDIKTLYEDHVDNAVIDAMLEGAEKGEKLTYYRYMLPVARLMKAYSWFLNLFGKVGPVPEGMSAEGALRNVHLTKIHEKIKAHTLELAKQFQSNIGFRPPYWELVALARRAKCEAK